MADPAAKPSEPEPPTPEPPSAVQAVGDRSALDGQLDAIVRMPPAEARAWLDANPPPPGRASEWSLLRRIIDDLPMTEAERKHADLVGRLAGLFDSRSPPAPAIASELLTWPGRDDFEQQLELWEAGLHPLQHTARSAT
jgi:hypothetical protein